MQLYKSNYRIIAKCKIRSWSTWATSEDITKKARSVATLSTRTKMVPNGNLEGLRLNSPLWLLGARKSAMSDRTIPDARPLQAGFNFFNIRIN